MFLVKWNDSLDVYISVFTVKPGILKCGSRENSVAILECRIAQVVENEMTYREISLHVNFILTYLKIQMGAVVEVCLLIPAHNNFSGIYMMLYQPSLDFRLFL